MSALQEQFKTIEEQRKLPVFLLCLEKSLVEYTYTDEVRASIDHMFNHSQMEYKLRGYTKDLFGMVSDCYLMYPMCHFRFCSIKATINFLKGERDRNPNASILRETSYAGLMDSIKTRLKLLIGTGFVVKTSFASKVGDEERHMIFYTGAKDTNSLVSAKLDRDYIVYHEWEFTIPANRVIGHGAAVYIASMVQLSSTFVNYEKGICRFLKTGTVAYPSEHKYLWNDTFYYVCFNYAFFHHNKDIQTEEEYKLGMFRRLEEIYSYLLYRVKDNTKGKESNVIVAVENENDLKTMGVLLLAQGYDNYDFLKRLYFTSASCMEQLGAFVQMEIQNGEVSYFVNNPPYFDAKIDC